MSDPSHAPHASAHGHDDGQPHEHISPLSMYLAVFGALCVLTVVTVAVSYMGFGKAAIYVAMVVAIAKAYMVCAYFMHLKWDDPFNRLVFVSAILFMAIFFVITATDLGFRGQVNPETDTMVLRNEEAAKASEDKRKEAVEKKQIELVRAAGSIPNGGEASPFAAPVIEPEPAPPKAAHH